MGPRVDVWDGGFTIEGQECGFSVILVKLSFRVYCIDLGGVVAQGTLALDKLGGVYVEDTSGFRVYAYSPP